MKLSCIMILTCPAPPPLREVLDQVVAISWNIGILVIIVGQRFHIGTPPEELKSLGERNVPVDDALRVDLSTLSVQRKRRWSWKQPAPASFTQPIFVPIAKHKFKVDLN